MIKAQRYHDISMGHRVVGHENKCRHLHGHNYRIHFSCTATELDNIGRVIDFGVIKEKLCLWLENNWDHKMMIWEQDPLRNGLEELANDDIILVPFNPTAENMAIHLVEVIGPQQLASTGVQLVEVTIDETRKCSASYSK